MAPLALTPRSNRNFGMSPRHSPRLSPRRSHSPLSDLSDLEMDLPVKPTKKETPGPGSYSSNYGDIGYNAQFKGKKLLGRHFMQDKAHAGPGPGAYPKAKLMSTSPRYSMQGKFISLGQAAEEAYPSPGPGEYNVAGDLSAKNAPTLKFRTLLPGDPLNPLKPKTGPGPGYYTTPEKKAETGRTKIIRPPQPPTSPGRVAPGPMDYSPRDPRKETVRSFPLTSRNATNPLGQFVDNTIPGPGAYHIVSACFSNGEHSTSATLPGKSFGENYVPETGNDIPGPGTYKIPHPPPSVGAKMIGKPKPQGELGPREVRPPPNQYEIPDGIGRGPRTTFKSRTNIPTGKEDNPGPGYYNPNYSVGDKSPRGLKIEKQMREEETASGLTPRRAAEQGPGPGHYDQQNELTDEVSKSMGITLKGKAKPTKEYCTVGPGTYNLPSTVGTGPMIEMHRKLPTYCIEKRPSVIVRSPRAKPKDQSEE